LFIVEACQKLGLTYSEYVMLKHIYQDEGAKQDELAEALFLDKAVVTRTVNMLEQKGFVRREQDSFDRRVKHIYLTERGLNQRAYLDNVLSTWIDYLIKDIPDDHVKMVMDGLDILGTRACDADFSKLVKSIPEGGEEDDENGDFDAIPR